MDNKDDIWMIFHGKLSEIFSFYLKAYLFSFKMVEIYLNCYSYSKDSSTYNPKQNNK